MQRFPQRCSLAEAIRVYAVDPRDVGIRHRDWGVSDGYLWVHTKDAWREEYDDIAMRHPQFERLERDGIDPAYVSYWFRPIVGGQHG